MSDISKIETISGLLLNIKDETARNLIQSEITDRTNADTTLQGNIDTNTEGIQNLTSGLSSTNKALKEETTNRQNAITSVTNSLNTEVKNRQDAVSTVTSSLNSEVTRAKGAESTLTTNLNAEITNRKNADTNINSSISTINSTLSSQSNEIKGINNTITANKKLTKLWTNSAPTSEFAKQSLNLGYTYDAILVICKVWKESDPLVSAIILNKNKPFTLYTTDTSASNRAFTLYNNTLSIGDGKNVLYSGVTSDNNGLLVPIEVYGIQWTL